MSAWQPIATAPKGNVLLFFPPIMMTPHKLPAVWRVGYARDFLDRPPTHWQPLTVPE